MEDLFKFFVNILSRSRTDRSRHRMADLSDFPKNIRPSSSGERRRYPREACLIESGYTVQNRWYRGHIQDISAGGAYVHSDESSAFSPGEDISLIARFKVLREHLRGKIAWVGQYGMGVQFLMSEHDHCGSETEQDDNYRTISIRASEGMGKIKSRKVRWEPSSTPEVVYRLYWSCGGGVDYNSYYADLGDLTEIVLPDDIPSFPLTAGTFELGISAINQAGNESELIKAVVHLDFFIPEPPKNLMVEAVYRSCNPGEDILAYTEGRLEIPSYLQEQEDQQGFVGELTEDPKETL
jgi:PilZ domain